MSACKLMNILLSGERNSGKSKLINEFLKSCSRTSGGFKTVRIKTQIDDFSGIYLIDLSKPETALTAQNRAGTCTPSRQPISHEHIFETVGAKALSFIELPDLIIMDEIGVLESECTKFKQKILECLSSPADVLGVVKKKNSDFLNSIRAREDVLILNVNSNNHKQIMSLLKEYLC